MSSISASATAATTPVPGSDDRAWYIVGRWQEYEGEARANLLRLAAVAAFYAIELINYYGVDLGFIRFPKVRIRPSTGPSPRSPRPGCCSGWACTSGCGCASCRRRSSTSPPAWTWCS